MEEGTINKVLGPLLEDLRRNNPNNPKWNQENLNNEGTIMIPGRHHNIDRGNLEVQNEPTIDTSHTVKSGAVASKNSNVVYIDPSIPQEFHPYLVEHETVEKHLMAGGMSYDKAHKYATLAEKHMVESAGGDWKKYTMALDPHVAEDTSEENTNPPPDPHINPEDAIGHHADKAAVLEKSDLNIGKETA